MFEMFVMIIAIVALVIAFFLLMTATTANVHEAIWEYGVLRSIGVTKAQGSRIFMYEAFVVVLAAAFLGFFVGLVVSTMVTAQFYLFVELPYDLEWPFALLAIMLVVSLVTTFFAVYIPMKQVNKA